MSDCNDCKLEGRVDALERRVEANEKKSSETHKEFYNRVRKLETDAAVRNEQYDTILEKLEGLTGTVNTLASALSDVQAEPGKNWKDFKGKAVWAVCAAVIAAVMATILARVGL